MKRKGVDQIFFRRHVAYEMAKYVQKALRRGQKAPHEMQSRDHDIGAEIN